MSRTHFHCTLPHNINGKYMQYHVVYFDRALQQNVYPTGMSVSSGLTLLTPTVARINVYLLMAIQALKGMVSVS